MVIDWFRFVFRQLAIALAVVTSILLLSEILMPSSILPYFNLHILVLVTFVVAVMSPAVVDRTRWSTVARCLLLFVLCSLLLAYAWLMFGVSTSGLMLLGGLGIVMVGLVVALCHPAKGDRLRDAESGGPTPAAWGTRTPLSDSVRLLPLSGENVVEIETITLTEDGIEIDETSVFMR